MPFRRSSLQPDDVFLIVGNLPQDAEHIAEIAPELHSRLLDTRQFGGHCGDHAEGGAGLPW